MRERGVGQIDRSGQNLSHQPVPPYERNPLIYKGCRVLVEVGGIEPPSEDTTSLALHA